MAFTKKNWKNRQSEHPTRRTLVNTGTTNVYDIVRSEGTISQEGDAFSAENMNDLEERIYNEFMNHTHSNYATSGHNHDSTYLKKTDLGTKEITLGTAWSNGSQTVNVSGITSSNSPILYPKLSDNTETAELQQAEWNKITRADTGNGTITFKAKENTTMAITVIVKGV